MGVDTCPNTSKVECIPLNSDNPSEALRGRADQPVRARLRPAGAESREERPSAATKGRGYEGANTRRSEAEAQSSTAQIRPAGRRRSPRASAAPRPAGG